MRRIVWLVLLLSLPATSYACRCAPQTLSDYFAGADYVAMARLLSFEDSDDQRLLEFELLAEPYKGGSGDDVMTVQLATAISTASCGVQPDINAVYVVFAHADDATPGHLRIDSCSGTRVHISTQLDEPVGFEDVPARFVAGQLNALAGMDVLREVSRNAPQSSDADNTALLGLLDLKALAHGGSTPLFAMPDKESPVVAEVQAWSDIQYREVGYEVPAASVFAQVPGWYLLETSGGQRGWAAGADAGTWFPYAELPLKRLAYLTSGWSGLLWPGAGAGLPMRFDRRQFDDRQEYPVNVLEHMDIGGMPWFRVQVLEDDPCSSGSDKVRGTGWVPGYDRDGAVGVWFYSRGC